MSKPRKARPFPPGRLPEAAKRKGYKVPFHLTEKLGLKPGNVDRWWSSERGPDAWNLTRLCWLLDVSPFYLYGFVPADDPRAHLAAALRDTVGTEEGDLVEAMRPLNPTQRAEFMRFASTWLAGATAGSKEAPSTTPTAPSPPPPKFPFQEQMGTDVEPPPPPPPPLVDRPSPTKKRGA